MTLHRTSRLALAALSFLTLSAAGALAGDSGGSGGEGGAGGVSMIPNAPRGGAAASVRDSYSGATRTVVMQPGGAMAVTVRDADGRVIERGARAAPPPRVRPPAGGPRLVHEKPVTRGYSLRTFDNGDGTATNVTVDANGQEVGRTSFKGDKAAKVIADAQKAHNAPPRVVILPR